jgi:(p)ppGpp synthase/HD superfamily hydrolase
LHDVIEDSQGRIGIGDIEEKFGRGIALMVSILTKPPLNENIPRERQLQVYYERITSSSLPTRIVKVADRLDNIRDCIDLADMPFQQRYLSETQKIYLPLAENTDQYLHDELVTACDALQNSVRLSAIQRRER